MLRLSDTDDTFRKRTLNKISQKGIMQVQPGVK